MTRSSKTRPGLVGCSGFSPSIERPVPREARAQIDASVLAERRHSLAGARVDGGQEAGRHVEQPAIAAVRAAPVAHPPRSNGTGVRTTPDLRAGRGVEGHQIVGARQHEQETVGGEGIEEERALPRRKRPRHLQPRHVGEGDLIERRELRGMRATQVAAPGGVGARVRGVSRGARLGPHGRQHRGREGARRGSSDDERAGHCRGGHDADGTVPPAQADRHTPSK